VRRLLAAAALIVFGMGLAGVAFEVAVRLFVPVSDFFWRADPVVGITMIPGKRGRFVKPGLFDVQVETNSHGFRDREHALAKPAGTTRILVLGDSYMEALQVPFERSLSALLEDELRRRGHPVEVINLGVSGFGTAREYLMLREYGLRYEPDLVLLFFVGNDLPNNSRRLEGLPYVPYPVPNGDGSVARDESGRPRFTPIVDRASPLGVVATVLKDYSKGYRFVRATIESSAPIHALLYRLGVMATPPAQGGPSAPGAPANAGLYEIYRASENPAWREAWALTEDFLLETKRLAADTRARLVVVLIPAPWEVYPALWDGAVSRAPSLRAPDVDPGAPARRLGAFLRGHGVAHVDLLPGFRERASASPSLYFPGDAHWTAAGHRLAADLLAEPVAAALRAP
jgi:hypothetical protein